MSFRLIESTWKQDFNFCVVRVQIVGGRFTTPLAVVPEPSTLALLFTGLAIALHHVICISQRAIAPFFQWTDESGDVHGYRVAVVARAGIIYLKLCPAGVVPIT